MEKLLALCYEARTLISFIQEHSFQTELFNIYLLFGTYYRFLDDSILLIESIQTIPAVLSVPTKNLPCMNTANNAR